MINPMCDRCKIAMKETEIKGIYKCIMCHVVIEEKTK